jgi:ketosteroid isomerase-like protein
MVAGCRGKRGGANHGGDLYMTAVDDVDQLIEQYQLALEEFVKGNPEPVKELYSHRDNVTLANPLGPPARGWEQVTKTIEHAASTIRDGEITSFDVISKLVTPELAYIVWIERQKAKMGARQDVTPVDLRVTMIFRPEDGTWKIVHRDTQTR